MKILLQFPEGLKQFALSHAKKLEEDGNEVFISSSPTFGACDLAIDEARKIGADKIVHFGHAEFHHVDFNVEYVEYPIDAPLEMLQKSLEELEGFNILGVVTTIQHVHQLESIKKFYEEHGKKVLIGKPYGFAKRQGQILGCDVGSAATINAEVDAFVYFGGGLFHPIGALLATTKPFFSIDPFEGKILRLDSYRETYKKRSKGRIVSSLEAKSIGILVSTKNGQYNMSLAKLIKDKIEKEGINAAILVSNTFDFTSLENMAEFDAFVNTACPRIATEDGDKIRKPIMSPNELMEMLEIRKAGKR
ncbi:MAG: diphthamide biosynthesis enzyme Dph2 [Candidatus Micrarchaeia archaeon]